MHFQQWDDEKYCNLGMMLLNNYWQALKIIDEDQIILNETLQARNISIEDLDRWQDEQVVLQGPIRRTGKGLRTGPDCNRFKRTNSPGPLNFFEKDRKRPRS